MKLPTNFSTEFLAESNLFLTQADFGNKLFDLLTPVQACLEKEQELLSFSLARFCGANSRLAFICQWHYKSLELSFDRELLTKENHRFWNSKIVERLSNLSDAQEILTRHINDVFIPQQIAFLQSKTRELINDFTSANQPLLKYYNNQTLNQIIADELTNYRRIYTPELTLAEFFQAQKGRLSFVQIALPCLVSLLFTFSQPGSLINPQKVKWETLEMILRHISAIHQIRTDPHVSLFVYETKLGILQELEWLEKPHSQQIEMSLESREVKEILDKHCLELYNQAIGALESFVFPEKYREMLMELLDWTKSLSS